MTPGDAHRVDVVRPRNPAILPLGPLIFNYHCVYRPCLELGCLAISRQPRGSSTCARAAATAFRGSARLRQCLSEGYGGVVAQPRGLFASHFAALKNATILRSFDAHEGV